jgi:hypothetical protein
MLGVSDLADAAADATREGAPALTDRTGIVIHGSLQHFLDPLCAMRNVSSAADDSRSAAYSAYARCAAMPGAECH